MLPAGIIGLACAIAVRCSSKGPIFFRQERWPERQAIPHLKFRTMADGINPIFPDQCEITKVGAVLRRLSLDELPQLINVTVGEMSIVGPRPTLVYQTERYNENQRRRLAVKPGLTGLAQISGRNSLTWPERINFDVRYVEIQSPMRDLRLVVHTFKAILLGDGVHGHSADDPLAVVHEAEIAVTQSVLPESQMDVSLKQDGASIDAETMTADELIIDLRQRQLEPITSSADSPEDTDSLTRSTQAEDETIVDVRSSTFETLN
ncbi:MAG: sugar transferase [Microthrixaceae bacterium]